MLPTTLAVIHQMAQELAPRINISPEEAERELIKMAEYMLSASVGSKYNLTQKHEEAIMLTALMDEDNEGTESQRMLLALISEGDSIDSSPSAEVAAFCTKCGQAFGANDVFCAKCGTKRKTV